MNCVEMLTWIRWGLLVVVARARAQLGAQRRACPSLLVLIPLWPELFNPCSFTLLPVLLLCRGHPTSLACLGHLRGWRRAGGCLRTRLFLPPP